jgi:hypothetical protein
VDRSPDMHKIKHFIGSKSNWGNQEET